MHNSIDLQLGLTEIREGVYDALMAAAEEHDRDSYEIICPAIVDHIASDGRFDAAIGEHALYITTVSGRRFKVSIEEA